MAIVTNILQKVNKNTGKLDTGTLVTLWVDGTTSMSDSLCGGLYNKDNQSGSPTFGQYFRWNLDGPFAISRLTTINQSNFQKLVNDFGATQATILIDTNLSLSANITIPKNIQLKWVQGAVITNTTTNVLTILSSVNEGAYQLFNNQVSVSSLVTLAGNDIIKVEWFGTGTITDGNGVINDSLPIQRAANAAYKKTMLFQKGVTYKFSNVSLPADIIVDGNKAIFNPYLPTSFYTTPLFIQSSNRIDPATGLYGGGTSYTGTATAPLIVTNGQIINCYYDALGSANPIGGFGVGATDFAIIKYLKYANNEIFNCSSPNVMGVSGVNTITATSSFINAVDILNNTIKWSGANQGLIVTNDYSLSTTSLNVRTIDDASISDRIMVGRFVQIGNFGVSGLDTAGTYLTSATVYRITSFTLLTPSSGTITIASGNYSTANGWIADSPNQGLRYATVTNSWLLPVSTTRFPSITSYPLFTGTAGSNTLTRSSTTATENAAATGLYVGLKFSFVSGCAGKYTIQTINATDGSITVTPTLASNVSSLRVFVDGNLSASTFVGGDIRALNHGYNRIYGGSHAFRGTGTTMGKGAYNDNLKSYFSFFNNEHWYNAMGMETQRGAPDPITTMISLFASLTLSAGQTTISPNSPTNYRVAQKDLDGDGTAENVICLNSTLDANITVFNSTGVGDIFMIDGVKGLYIITNIPTDWSTTPSFTISRWDVPSKSPIGGGLINGVATSLSSSNLNFRVYSYVLGAYGSFRQLKVSNCIGRYPIDTYHTSIFSDETIIENCDFESAERTQFELGGNKLLFRKNNVRATVFIPGGKIIPAGMSFTSGRGYGGYISLSSADIIIEENKFDGFQPTTGYSVNSGNFSTIKNAYYLNSEERFVLKNNVITGGQGTLTFSNSFKTISSVVYPSYAYDFFQLSKNTFIFNAGLPDNSTFLRTIHGLTTIVTNNVLQVPTSNTNLFIFANFPNPEMFGSGPFNTKISGNIYSIPAISLSAVSNTTMALNVLNGDAKVGIAPVVPTTSAPTTSVIPSQQYGVYKNSTTGITTLYYNDSGIIKDFLSGVVINVSSANSDISVVNPTTTPVLTLNNINGISKAFYDPTSSIQSQLNNKSPLLTLTTTGISGVATLVGNILNIPNYAAGGGMSNPMTTLGDVIYGGAGGVPTRLSGNTTTTRKFLGSLGNGTISAAPTFFDLYGSTNSWTGSNTFTTTLFVDGALNLKPTNTNPINSGYGAIYINTSNTMGFYNGVGIMNITFGSNGMTINGPTTGAGIYKLPEFNGTFLLGTNGSFSGVGTATTVFTVTIGVTQPNTTYRVNITPTSALSSALFYITNKTNTTFDVVYLAGLTGTVTFDWNVFNA